MNNPFCFRKRRGITEIVGTMMILVLTVAGAVILSNLLSDHFFSIDQHPTTEARMDSIQLTGYDTRDSVDLTDVPDLSNTFNQLLCVSNDPSPPPPTKCKVTLPNNLPSNVINSSPDEQGTEFIVLQIRNMNIDSVFIHNVLINNVAHSWDQSTSNQNLDLTANDPTIPPPGSRNYPLAGTFSIIPVSNDAPIIQQGTNEILGDGEVRLVIKLSDQIPQDIGMWSSLRILVNFGGPQPAEFIILSGDAKW
jgi:hypothetical protein